MQQKKITHPLKFCLYAKSIPQQYTHMALASELCFVSSTSSDAPALPSPAEKQSARELRNTHNAPPTLHSSSDLHTPHPYYQDFKINNCGCQHRHTQIPQRSIRYWTDCFYCLLQIQIHIHIQM